MRKILLLSFVLSIFINAANGQSFSSSTQMNASAQVVSPEGIECSDALVLNLWLRDNSTWFHIHMSSDGALNSVVGGNQVFGVPKSQPAKCSITNGTFTNTDNFLFPEGDNLLNSHKGISYIYDPTSANSPSYNGIIIRGFEPKISEDGKSVSIGAHFFYPPGIISDSFSGSIPIVYVSE